MNAVFNIGFELARVAYREGKESNGAQKPYYSIEERENACDHSRQAYNYGTVDQLQRADRQNVAPQVQVVLILDKEYIGEKHPGIVFQRVHDRLPTDIPLRHGLLGRLLPLSRVKQSC